MTGSRTALSVVFDDVGVVSIAARDVPPPGPGYARIRIVACGVCNREWNVLSGRLPRRFPTVMGHEPVGIVDAVGRGVTHLTPGAWAAGVGQASLAEFDNVEAAFFREISFVGPEHEVLVEPVMCAVNAVNRILSLAPRLVVVNGVGFMGNLLVQALRRRLPSAAVVAVDQTEAALTLALARGAVRGVRAGSTQVDELAGKADVVFEASGALGSVLSASRMVRNGGALALFAHHFSAEPDAVNDWHMRGIAVLNTVPWASPDLGAEVEEAVRAIEEGAFSLAGLVRRVAPLTDAPALLMSSVAERDGFPKTVITFPRR